MLFVMILKWQSGLSKEQRDGVLMRRAQWNYPEGVRLIGEYWPQVEDAAVVSIFETNDHKSLMEISLAWGDAFNISVSPAVSVEDGLRMGAEILGAGST
jgi:hypothetical protein